MSSLAIPMEILNDTKISLNVKNFYATVVNLCQNKGYCWGTNEYFAKKFGRTVRTISKWVSELITHNYLISEMVYADKKHKKNQRQLRLVNNSNTISTSRYTWKNFHMPKSDSEHDKSDKALKKSQELLNKYNKDINTSVFPTEKHIARAHARTSETKNYIAKKFDDKKRTPEGVLRVVEKNKLSLKYNSTLEAQGARIHATKGYIFNAPKSIDAARVSEDTLSTVENIIKALNQEALRNYKPNAKQTLGFIIPLLEQGYKFADFVKVITTKCRDWLGTPFAKYLRPKTLFRADNFAKYSNQHDQNSRENWTCNQKVIQPRQNKFANFKQREWDFEKIEFLSQYDSASEEDLRRFEERRQARKAMERPKVENTRQNRFQNFARRKWDFAKIKYLNQLRDDEPYTEEGLAEYRKYYEAQKAEREKREAENPRPTRFHNFEQRKWDFEEIRRLMYADYEDDTENSAQRSLREKQELISRVEGNLDFYEAIVIQFPNSLEAERYRKYLEYTQEQGNEPSPKVEQEPNNGT